MTREDYVSLEVAKLLKEKLQQKSKEELVDILVEISITLCFPYLNILGRNKVTTTKTYIK